MTSSPNPDAEASGSTRHFRKRLLGWTLALSVALHLAAALAVILAGALKSGEHSERTFSIQEIDLAPSIRALRAPKTGPPAAAQPPAMASPPAADAPESGEPEREPAPESPPEGTPESAPEGPASPGPEAASVSSSLSLGMEHGFFSGLADGATLREDVREYYAQLVEKINRQWWEQAALLKEPLRRDGVFELLVQRDGALVSIQVAQGTGSPEADLLLAGIIAKSSPLPPLPASYNLSHFMAPLRIKAPLFLFRMKN